MRASVIGIALVLVGCGGGSDADQPDAAGDAEATPRPCFPDVTHVPQGTAVLGGGRDGHFEPMLDVYPLDYGTQDGFMVVAHARMTGFAPGNPTNLLDPGNPFTRIRAFFDDTNIPLNLFAECAFRIPYVPAGDGEYELVSPAYVIFETCWRSEHLFGAHMRIELEIMDENGHYASDVKHITAQPPTNGIYPLDYNTPGCVLPRVQTTL